MNLRKLLLISTMAAVIAAPIISTVAHAQTPILVMDSSGASPGHLTPDAVQSSVNQWLGVATVVVGAIGGFVVFLFGKIGEVKAQIQSHQAQLQQQQQQLNTHALALTPALPVAPVAPPASPSTGLSLTPALIAALACAMLFLPGCAALKLKAQRDAAAVGNELANTDITASASYDGVTVTGGRVSGRNSVNVNVDPKEVVKAINR